MPMVRMRRGTKRKRKRRMSMRMSAKTTTLSSRPLT
jgi:hypothetical protein